MQAVKVPAKVKQGIDEVREHGKINMFKVNGIITLCMMWNLNETARWIQNNEREYIRGLSDGFEVDNGDAQASLSSQ